MGNFFGDLFSPATAVFDRNKKTLLGQDPFIETKTITDPSKQAVNNPLSAYLASNVGKGLPRYDQPLTADLPYGGGGSVGDYLSLSYGDLKSEAKANFKSNYSDLLEGSAGALSSSSRAYNDNTALTNLELGLVDKRQGLATSQYDIASKMQAAETAAYQAKYADWMKSLPEYNPILDKALAYLNGTVSTGTDVLSALNPGKEGLLGDIIKAAGSAAAAGAGGCWLASEIFGGWYHPKTNACRVFIYNIAPSWFRSLYHRYAPGLSYQVHNNKVLRLVLKPIFEVFASIGGKYGSL